MLKKITLLAGIILCLSTALNGEPDKKNWGFSVETGSGNMLSIACARQNITKFINIGTGAGFNYKKESIGIKDYGFIDLNGNVFSSLLLFTKDNIHLSGRVQFGYDYLSADGDFFSGIWDITPALMFGFKNFYAAFSYAVLLTKETAYVPEIGIGYQFQF